MFKLLILLVIVLGVVAVLQLARVHELTATLRKKREEEISYADNRMNALLMLLFMIGFFISFIYLMIRYGDYLPPSASAHGEEIDTLMAVNLVIVIAVFFFVNAVLFYFAYKYYYRKDRKALFFAHDNRLELVWTVIPSIVLAFIIIYRLVTWNEITDDASEDALRVEVYSKQFDWTVRYTGDDGKFGNSNFNLISTDNPLGIITKEAVNLKLGEIEVEIAAIQEELQAKRNMMPDAKVEALEEKIERLVRHKNRINEFLKYKDDNAMAWEDGKDDRIAKGEFHLPVGKEVEFIFRSRDVIHSAFMPHFRAQMNAVPGMPTRFKMTPTITTDSMRTILNNPEFDYILLCNKVCGAAHFNMQMTIVIESEDNYLKWLAAQKTFIATEPAASDSLAPAVSPAPADPLPAQNANMDTNPSAAVVN